MTIPMSDIRDLAVAMVDATHGYTIEFSNSPEAHAAEYDELERLLRNTAPGDYAAIGIDDYSFDYPFTLPRCESRKREGRRSWRCTKAVGHQRRHVNMGGGRLWS